MAIDKNQRADTTHICVNDSRNTDKLRLLTDIVHKYDSKIIAQISYPGHHGSKMEGQISKTPSGLGDTIAFSKKDIDQCIINHVTTIEFLQKVGFDGIQLHMAHGYLLSEFLDPFYNKRTDNYVGNINNSYRIIHEILMKINKTIKIELTFLNINLNGNKSNKLSMILEDKYYSLIFIVKYYHLHHQS